MSTPEKNKKASMSLSGRTGRAVVDVAEFHEQPPLVQEHTNNTHVWNNHSSPMIGPYSAIMRSSSSSAMQDSTEVAEENWQTGTRRIGHDNNNGNNSNNSNSNHKRKATNNTADRNAIIVEKKQKLDETTTRDERKWLEMWERLKTYYKMYGDYHVPQHDYSDDARLYSWIATQRKLYRQQQLPLDRVEKLSSINFAWQSEDCRKKEERWEQQYSKLVQYHQQRSHCRVSTTMTDDDKPLYSWAAEQRKLYNKGVLANERQKKLERIGFEFQAGESRDEAWNRMYNRLKDYYNTNNRFHCRVSTAEDKQLSQWVTAQRRQHWNGNLPEDRKEKLDKLGFDFRTAQERVTKPQHEEAWNEMMGKMLVFHRRFGHCRVPDKWKEDPKLSRWVNLQRHHYRYGKLKKHRQTKLESIGFTFRIRGPGRRKDTTGHVDQRQQQQQLFSDQGDGRYQEEFGNNNYHFDHSQREEEIDKGPAEDPGNDQIDAEEHERILAMLKTDDDGRQALEKNHGGAQVTEVSHQLHASPATLRTDHKGQVTEAADHCLDPAENKHSGEQQTATKKDKENESVNVAKSRRIDPDKRPKRGRSWNESFAALGIFKAAHGHTRVPRRYEEDQALGRWVIQQRAAEKAGTLQEDLRARLEAIGFSFSKKMPTAPRISPPTQRRRSWDESYALLKAYKEKYGTTDVPRGWKEDYTLSNWVRNQRHQRERLSDERRAKLDSLGFSYVLLSSDYDAVWEENFKLVKAYKEQYGTFPRESDRDYRKLGLWLLQQRAKPASLSEERRGKLEAIGVPFSHKLQGDKRNTSKADKVWLQNFDKLVEFKGLYGHTSVPENYVRAPKLNDWVLSQRRFFRANRLRDDRRKLLENIGFDFGPQNHWWLK